VTVNLQVTGESISAVRLLTDTTCSGGGGFSDLKAGASIVIKDGNRNVVATGALPTGSLNQSGGSSGEVCTWRVPVPNVPDRPFYTVSVGTRGGPRYGRDSLASKRWTMNVSLTGTRLS
jgi:hypothetical protein